MSDIPFEDIPAAIRIEPPVLTGHGGACSGEARLGMVSLPDDPKARKALPVYSGVLAYFPDALCEVARCSMQGNQQHHPDKPLHWDKSKSTDEADALVRHLLQRGTLDTDGIRHTAKVAWRALALLQRELEDLTYAF